MHIKDGRKHHPTRALKRFSESDRAPMAPCRVDPALTSHAAKRQAARAEVMKQRRLATEEKRLIRKKEDDDGAGHAKGKSRGRGRGPKEPTQDP